MRLTFYLLIAIVTGMSLIQCDRDSQMENHHMNDEQMGQMMQNPEARKAMMTQMAQDPEMRQEMMRQMRSSMMNMDQDQMLDHMEQVMNDAERRQQMISHMTQMVEILESGEFNREEMKQMMNESPMAGMNMRCMMMGEGD